MAIVQRAKGKIRFAFKDALKVLSKNPNKESLIMLHFSYGKIRFKYTTGYYSRYNDWDYSNQRLKNKATILNRAFVNDFLNSLKTELYKEVSYLESIQSPITKDALRSKLDILTNKDPQGENKAQDLNFYEYFDNFLNLRKSTLKKITIRSYNQTKRLLKEYNSRIDFDGIDLSFYYGFIEFLEEDDKSVNTIGKHIKNLKSILRSATQDGLNKNLAYTKREFKVLKERTTAIHLDEKELKLMADYDLSAFPNLDLARDIFLIGCYTGQRVSDYNGLTKANFYQKDGLQFFKIKQQKTNKEVFCPVTLEIKTILAKYKNVPPKKMNEPDINEYIKEVGRKVGLTQTEIKNYTRGGIERAEEIPKYKMISSHTARRSFCTNMYEKGMPIYDIMHFSGHASEKEFYNYIRTKKEQRAIKIAQSGFFNLSD
ncbi:site-specific integrase [Cellulophaga sp. 20_2_10]|uniref:site-specific integrase n=1 Tax=Cellulophaga sp. 20_2_10 TaxID=2942476 RepID=UPI00201AC076|nr:site-specific integrase [Cellulophaga sp. 20_2_10]MCL5246524.1 site-specific integrase [Cellulophaga sp. 20_2_10]